jgi:hypothetical protein
MRNLVKITFLEEWRRLVWASISLQNLLENEGMVHPCSLVKQAPVLGVVDVVQEALRELDLEGGVATVPVVVRYCAP